MSAITIDTLPDGTYGESVTDGKRIVRGPEGITVEDGAQGPRIPVKGDFDENLAEYLTVSERRLLAMRLIEYLAVDKESRADWDKAEERGMQIMGITKPPDKQEKDSNLVLSRGKSQVKMPMIMEAATNFQARSIAELFPSTGPVKSQIIGTRTKELVEQADRIETFGNYYLTVMDDGYFADTDQMLLYLPFAGSVFRKGGQDYISGLPQLRYVKASNFVAPYAATTLRDAPRYAHTYGLTGQDVRRAMESGMFSTVTLNKPVMMESNRSKVADQSDGRAITEHDDDANYQIAEYHIDLELPVDRLGQRKGPHKIGETPQQDLLSYIVIVETSNPEILMIRRNWKESDQKRQKRIWFAHHKLLPGLGFYGWGYPHVIGSLQKAANDAVNTLLDSGYAASFQGGFITKEGVSIGLNGEIELEHGVWKVIKGTYEELSKAMFSPDFKPPSAALAQLTLQLLEAGRRFASVTEVATGEADNTGPVGTTLALIEQSNVVPTSIHKRLHNSMGLELKMWAELVYDFMPNDYVYEKNGETKHLLRSDFDGRVDVVPVSDPNIWSQKQRIALCQGTLELQARGPDLYSVAKRVEAHRRMMEAMRIPDIEAIGPESPDTQRYLDPVAENGLMIVGSPVHAFEPQDHSAHLAVHQHGQQMFVNSQAFAAMQPEKKQQVISAMDAHNAEHLAYLYRRIAFQAAGIPAPPLEQSGMPQSLPPELEAQITAAVVSKLPPLPPPPQKPAEGEDQAAALAAKTQADIQAKDIQAKAAISRDTEAFIAEEIRKQKAFEAEQARADAMLNKQEDRKDTETATKVVREAAAAKAQRIHEEKAAELKLKTAAALAAQKHRHAEKDAEQSTEQAADTHAQELEHGAAEHELEQAKAKKSTRKAVNK